MRGALQLMLLLAVPLASARAEVLDRIIATVNGEVVLASELEDSVSIQRLMSGGSAAVDRSVELERLIDRALIGQQLQRSSMPEPSESEVAARVAELRAQIAPQSDDAGWAVLLASHGLTEADLRSHISLQLAVLRFIELRFRPSVYVSEKEIEKYYRESFIPQLRPSSAEPPPLTAVSAQIREIIVQQRVDDLLAQWLRARRAQTVIRRLTQPQNADRRSPSEQAAQ